MFQCFIDRVLLFVKVYLCKRQFTFPISESNIPVNILENIDFLVSNSPYLAENSPSVHKIPLICPKCL